MNDYKETRLYKTYPKLYEAVFIKKRNIFITGIGGCGKSYSIKLIKEECDRLQLSIGVTSTTGVSAHSLGAGASTIHRWSGIKLGDKPLPTILDWIRKNKEKRKRWTDTQILVIDEVSMLGAKTLELLNRVGQAIRYGDRLLKKEANPLPFGGVQIIFSGDVLQLQPVNDEYCFKSSVWNNLNLYIFRCMTPYRYPDIKHFEMLSRVRTQEYTKEDLNVLQERVIAYYKYKENISNEKIKPTRIFPLKKDVEAININELEALEGSIICYEADDTFINKTKDDDISRNEYIEYMDNIAPREVLLKVGAQVMLTQNLSVEEGLVNGSRGVVEVCDDDKVTVQFKNGMLINITSQAYDYEDEKVICVRSQFPLILAWASSCHKSQGSTLDYAIIDLGTSLFAAGMGYVMLSRCKTLDGIFIVNLIPKMVRADPEALEYEKYLLKMDEENLVKDMENVKIEE